MIGIDAYETIAIALYESWVRARAPEGHHAPYHELSPYDRQRWRKEARDVIEEASERRVADGVSLRHVT